ncbi:hypothetical protein LCGC14_0755130 [marine sediment metagenome]|uniref:Uncharacterized protein n=1 Tax=marine sediment metagenome TaxID=412755 RepID=A0A0F9Q756_9ZZZZ
MSYEGYTVYLCCNGHRNYYDAYDDTSVECEDCGAAAAWRYDVDQTNDSGMEPVLVEHKPAKTEHCPTCGHGKQVAEQRFELPENAGVLLVHQESLNVPLGPVKFRDNDSDKVFDTEDAVQEHKYRK